MSNMNYCRFENTLADLRDAYKYMDDDLGDDEKQARQRLIEMCAKIADEYRAEVKS